MPLLLDGPPSTIEDLTDQDSGLLDVCNVERIDLSRKLVLSRDQLAVELNSFFDEQRVGNYTLYPQPQLGASHVAVSDSLKLWHTWQTLALVYRDVYFNQLNDRFKAKWTEYQRLSDQERDRVRSVGVGLVSDPLLRPAPPVMNLVPAVQTGGTFYVAVSLLNAANEESAPSTVSTLSLPDGNAINVSLAAPPANATAWNVYAGRNPATIALQNNSPVDIDSGWVVYPSALTTGSRLPGPGQAPGFIKALPQRIRRG